MFCSTALVMFVQPIVAVLSFNEKSFNQYISDRDNSSRVNFNEQLLFYPIKFVNVMHNILVHNVNILLD